MRIWILPVALLGAWGCSSVEQQAEEAIRNHLASQGAVKQVDLSPQGNGDNLSGFAVIGTANGDVRLECTARRLEGSQYDLNCAQEIDQGMIAETENLIRTQLGQQGVTVNAISMRRESSDRMVGTASVSDASGASGELTCSAVRETAGSRQFAINCQAPAQ